MRAARAIFGKAHRVELMNAEASKMQMETLAALGLATLRRATAAAA